MFCSKKSTKEINAVHERSLRIIRNDYESLYPLLLMYKLPLYPLLLTMYKLSYDRSL